MANAKSKVHTPKNQSSKSNGCGKVGRPKKSITNINTKKDAPIQVMKNLKTTRVSYDKVQDYLQKSNIQEKNIDPIRDFKIPKRGLLSKHGHIRNKNKHNFKLFNNILKSELLIEESNDASSNDSGNVFDNNNVVLTDQNKDETNTFVVLRIDNLFKDGVKRRKSKTKKRSVEKCTKDKQKTKSFDKDIFFECDYCKRKFNNKCSLRRHIRLHVDSRTFTCSQCKKVFRKQLYLSAHIKRQHPNWAAHYMCTMCDKPFLLKENLKVHMLSHTKNETMFKCIYCKEEYSDQQDLIEHEKQHLVDGRYQCIICESSFDSRNRLSLHYRSHLKVKDFICQHCGKEFIRLNSMRRHVQICHAGIRIQCPICKKYLKGHLSEHMRTHEKERPHECPDCGQRFTQSTQLNVHRRSHTGARPYPCRICGRPFSHSNALMLHIRRHTGEKPFICAMCPISFSQLPHMKAHMRNIHGKLKPYKCQKCKQFFKLKVELENHAKDCTTGDRELTLEEKEESDKINDVESGMSLSRMRFLLALLLTMIATKEKLKFLGFNKRLIDDLLVESLEAMGHRPCKDDSLTPLKRLKTNIQMLLNGTVPKDQMAKFKKENKSTEELLELLTNEKKNN